MLNYEVDPALLAALVPAGTELDFFEGQALVSLVGFQFLDTRVLGVPVPFHREFEELNLRFYVQRRCGDELRRGVVFIKEIVPRVAVSTIARLVYQENYVTMPMQHEIVRHTASASGLSASSPTIEVVYRWRPGRRWNELRAKGEGELFVPGPGSAEEFITEHYWGYTALRNGRAAEFRVEHSPWRLWLRERREPRLRRGAALWHRLREVACRSAAFGLSR